MTYREMLSQRVAAISVSESPDMPVLGFQSFPQESLERLEESAFPARRAHHTVTSVGKNDNDCVRR
jgi:hypothetical protein